MKNEKNRQKRGLTATTAQSDKSTQQASQSETSTLTSLIASPHTNQPTSHSTQLPAALTIVKYMFENTVGFSTGKQDISIGFYNINTLNSDKLKVTIEFMQKFNIDITILIDTKVGNDAVHHYSTQARELIMHGCYVASHPVEPSAGGQMILAQPK